MAARSGAAQRLSAADGETQLQLAQQPSWVTMGGTAAITTAAMQCRVVEAASCRSRR